MQKKSVRLTFVNDEGLRTLIVDRTDEGIFAWNEGTCISNQTFVLRFGSLDLLGDAMALFSWVLHNPFVGTLFRIVPAEILALRACFPT